MDDPFTEEDDTPKIDVYTRCGFCLAGLSPLSGLCRVCMVYWKVTKEVSS